MNIGIEFDVFKDIIESKIDKQNIIKKLFLNPNKDLSSQVIEQLKNEGNNIYIIINENNYEFIKQNREKYKIIIKKFLNKSNIKYDDIIFVNQYDREFIYENRVEMVLTSNINTEIDSYIPVIYVTDKECEPLSYVYKANSFEEIYKIVNNYKYSYKEEIKPRTSIPSIDKEFRGFYSELQKNVKIPESTIYEYLCEKNKKNMDNVAIDYFGKKLKFKQFLGEIEKCAKAYIKSGIKKGDVVTICMPNTPEGVIAFYAANKIGAVANMIHPLSAEHEILDYLNETDSKIIIALNGCYNKIKNIEKYTKLEKIVFVSPSNSMPSITKIGYKLTLGKKDPKIVESDKINNWKKFIESGKDVTYVEQNTYSKNKLAVLLHTGGTTGKSKAAMLTNENFNSNVEQLRVTIPSYKKGDSLLAVTPIFHGFGLANCVHTALCVDMSVTLLPQFKLKNFIKTMLRTKSNLILGVPTLWSALIKSDLLKGKDLSFLKVLISGGDTLDANLEAQINEFLKSHNAPNKIYKGYGMTEALAAISFSTDNSNVESTIGIPLPCNQVKVVDINTKKELGYGEEGEFCIKGPTNMQGYYKNIEETNKVIQDGYLYTGDLGYLDKKGRLHYTQRLKRLIVSSGYNIYPSQIEAVIKKHNLVENCIVIGVPHPYKVNVPKAYVVIKKGYETQKIKLKKELDDLCKVNLLKMSIPKEIEFISELPKTNMGKVDYRSLEEANQKVMKLK